MPSISIDDIWTFENMADPTLRANSFLKTVNYTLPGGYYESAFGIALLVTCTHPTYADLRIQLVNYRGDPTTGKMWAGAYGVQSSIDLDGDLPGLSFLKNTYLNSGQSTYWMWWPRYSDLFGSVRGGMLSAICEIRAQIQSSFGDFSVSKPQACLWSFMNS
jgi:hypothetical protein